MTARKLLEKKGSRWSQDKNSALKQLQLLQVQAAVKKATRAQLEEAVDICEKVERSLILKVASSYVLKNVLILQTLKKKEKFSGTIFF